METDAIHETYGPMIRRIAASFAGPSDREDLEQEILLAILRAARGFREEASEKTFVYRIAQNCGVNYLRKRRDDSPFEDAPDHNTPESIATERQQSEALAAMVRALPLALRQPIVLRMEGLSYAEIADIIGISESLVGVRIHRATESLKAKRNEVEQ